MTLEEWMERREPPVPEGFRDWMVPSAAGRPATVEALAEEAGAALERALS